MFFLFLSGYQLYPTTFFLVFLFYPFILPLCFWHVILFSVSTEPGIKYAVLKDVKSNCKIKENQYLFFAKATMAITIP